MGFGRQPALLTHMPAVALLHANMQVSAWLGIAAPAVQQLQRRHGTFGSAGAQALTPAHAPELRLACSVLHVHSMRRHRAGWVRRWPRLHR